MLDYILFVLGFYFLARGAGLLVDGSASLAKRFGVSDVVIGLTIVAFGTSAPEFVVNIISSVKGSSDLVLGDIIGSNISNILLILGATAMIYPLRVKKAAVWKEMQLSVVAVIAVIVMINDSFFGLANHENMITRTEGIILILFFVLFMYFMFSAFRSGGAENVEGTPAYRPLKASMMVFVGLVGLVLGGKWIVDGALLIASNFGVSEGFVGLTLLALGTSLPELATSFVAAYKKNVDIAVGNIVGSNIFNIFGVLGVSAIINPVTPDFSLNSDLVLLLIVTFMILSLVLYRDEHNISRKQGLSFLFIYVLYLVFLFWRG